MQQEIKENNKIKRMKQNYSPKTSLLVASVEGSVVTLKVTRNECVVKISLLHSLILEKGSRGFPLQSFNNEASIDWRWHLF
jgi:hypothetical protein